MTACMGVRGENRNGTTKVEWYTFKSDYPSPVFQSLHNIYHLDTRYSPSSGSEGCATLF